MPKSANPNGTMNASGILDQTGKLTPEAKKKFITDVENELIFGTPDIAFPCGDKILPEFGADRLDLHDEIEYEAFHKSWVQKYEDIANIMNLPKCRLPLPFPPIDITFTFDPLPNIDFDVALKLLTLKLPDLAIELPKLGIELPVPFPGIPLPPPLPDFTLPKLDFGFDLSLDLPHIQFQINLILKLPEILLKFALPDVILPKLPNIALLLPEVCAELRKQVFKSEYEDQERSGVDTTDLAASMVISRNTAKMAVVDICGLVVGCGGVVTKGVAAAVDLTPPVEVEKPAVPAAFYDINDAKFWDHYVYMCNRLEVNPLVLGQVIQFESQWDPFKKVIGGATKAMGFVMIMPWWYTGNDKDAFPQGIRMKTEYWKNLYTEKSTASRHASDDLFWTEQFFLNTWVGSYGKTMAELKTPKAIYDRIVNPSYNKEGGHAPFTGATIHEPHLSNIKQAMNRVGSDKGTRMPQPDSTDSARIDWGVVSLDDIKSHPFQSNQSWWRTLEG